MKLYLKSLCIFFASIHVTYGGEFDLSRLGELLGLKDVRLISEDVTARESEARDITFTSVKIISSPTDDQLFPLIVYTAPLGQINTDEYKEVREEFRKTDSKNRSDHTKTMGFIFEGKDEAFSIMEEVRIASNNPPRIGEPRPWQPSHAMGISIVGSLKSENMDFQIFVTGPSEETAAKYPDYKKFFENPIHFREFGKDMFVAVKHAGLLGSKDVIIEEINAREQQSSKELSSKTYAGWIIVGFFVLGLGYFVLKRFRKRREGE